MSQNLDTSAQLASLSPQDLQTIADLVVSKLTGKNTPNVLPKQAVAGSSPVTRSPHRKGTTCFPFEIGRLVSRYHLWAQSQGLAVFGGKVITCFRMLETGQIQQIETAEKALLKQAMCCPALPDSENDG